MASVHRTWHAQDEGRDLDLEALPVRCRHLVVTMHRSERCAQWTPRRVLERVTGFEHGLFADDSSALHDFDFAFGVGDDPRSIQQLHGARAFIRDADGVRIEPATLLDVTVIGAKLGLDANADPTGASFWFGHDGLPGTCCPDPQAVAPGARGLVRGLDADRQGPRFSWQIAPSLGKYRPSGLGLFPVGTAVLEGRHLVRRTH